MSELISGRIVEWIRAEGLAPGTHLPAQRLADELRVSRSPVNDALKALEDKGFVRREPNRGFFIAPPVKDQTSAAPLDEVDTVTGIYFRIAEDHLRGVLAADFTETRIKERYQLTTTQLREVLRRISEEGWAQKKAGYGWRFSQMLTTPESLLQSYRLRLALEPQALLEPGYRITPQTIARCRAAETHLLKGGIETDTADQLHDRGVRFHESLVEASGNPFFIETIKRVNRVRRLLAYRSMRDRKRFKQHCQQHLQILRLLEQERNEEAANALRDHLSATLKNLNRIRDVLEN